MQKNKNFNDIDFYTIIHTINGNSDTAILPEEEIRQKAYVRRFSILGGKAVYQLNPNKYQHSIGNLSEFLEVISAIKQELYIEDYKITRFDLAVNTKIEYNKLYKINNYFKELCAVYIGKDNSYFTTGADFKKRSLKISSRDFDLEIYDKDLESKGKDPAKTRIEFRFKRLGVKDSVETCISKLLKMLYELPKAFEKLNNIKTEQLYAQYLYERSNNYEGRVLSLPEFVSKYADHIFNMDILKGLYGKIYMGKCKNWLYRYRTNGRTLTLFSKSEIISYVKLIRTAIKNYSKSTAKQSPLVDNNNNHNAA